MKSVAWRRFSLEAARSGVQLAMIVLLFVAAALMLALIQAFTT